MNRQLAEAIEEGFFVSWRVIGLRSMWRHWGQHVWSVKRLRLLNFERAVNLRVN